MKVENSTVNKIRSFNRYYTNILGLLNKHILGTSYSLTEARILFEINEIGYCNASALADRLNIDKSYMSRIINKFEKAKLIEKKDSDEDNRSNIILLTKKGQDSIQDLMNKSNHQIEALLTPLSSDAHQEIEHAMEVIRKHFTLAATQIVIRPFTEEDIHFIIYNQLALYEIEYGLTAEKWKTYVSEGVSDLVKTFDAEKDCMFIVEKNGVQAGCIAITHLDKTTAQLRFFFIETSLRGFGAGNMLMKKALDFCRSKAYQKIVLWTFSELTAARHLYTKNGFRIEKTHENNEWGKPVTEEKWVANLNAV